MAINRLTYRFHAHLVPSKSTGDVKTYRTYFPFIKDLTYAIPNSMTFEDAVYFLIKESANFGSIMTRQRAIELLLDYKGEGIWRGYPLINWFYPGREYFLGDVDEIQYVTDFGGTIDTTWNVGLYLNDVLVHVCNSPQIAHRKGVLDAISFIYYNEKGDLVGDIAIDTSANGFGLISDDAIIEIAAVVSEVYSPWIYYGLQPDRAKMAEALGRDAVGMGGIHPSLTPSQSLQFSYFVDGHIGDTSDNWQNSFLPLVSMTFLPSVPLTAGVNDEIFLMFDVLDGNLDEEAEPKTMIRSSTKFSVSQVGLSSQLGGRFVNIINTGVNASNYRTINSKRMEVQTKTYEEEKVIKNTSFYIVAENKTVMNNFYNGMEKGFSSFVNDFVDYDTCRFSLYTFSTVSGIDAVQKYAEETDADGISLFFNYMKNSNKKSRYTPSLQGVFENLCGKYIAGSLVREGEIYKDYEKDVLLNSDFADGDYVLIILSDLDFQEKKKVEEKKVYIASDNFESSKTYLNDIDLTMRVKVSQNVYRSQTINVRCGILRFSNFSFVKK